MLHKIENEQKDDARRKKEKKNGRIKKNAVRNWRKNC